VLVYFPKGSWQGGEIVEWETTDGGDTWTRNRSLTPDPQYPNNYVERVVNASPELELFWSSGITPATGRLHAWGRAETLPAPHGIAR
jgi:hypothetical protein